MRKKGRRFTREELHELVWSAPISQLARRFEISDVGLSKACRRSDIPVPPRGYWARLRAGKRVAQMPLPPRGPGMPDEVVIGGGPWWERHHLTEAEIEAIVPTPPVFTEAIAEVAERVRKSVGKVSMPRDLAKPHRLVVQLLEQDEQRQNEQRNSTFPSPWNAPKFDSPVEQRRLRIINAMFNALERCGMKPSIDKEARELGVTVGEQFVGFTLDPVAARRARSVAPAKERKAAAQLTLVIGGSRGAPDGRLTWVEQPGSKIENRITEIVIELIVTGEKRYRANAQAHYEWIVERKAAIEEERRRAQEEAEQREHERQQQLEQSRIERLLEEAGALRKAREIRTYVQTVCEANPSLDQPLSDAELETWASWALAHADRIDPVRSGRFRARWSERDE